MDKQLHTISLLVSNKPGVLLRICLVFSRRGFNIESLVVSQALDGRFSRMTITAEGDAKDLDQIIKQAGKLVDVVDAGEHDDLEGVVQELALIKVTSDEGKRSEILQIVEHFKAETVHFASDSVIVKVSGDSEKIDSVVEVLRGFGILELVRSGKLVIGKGS